MNRFIPVSITRLEPGLIKVEWKDGFSAKIKLEDFRKECPCASCQGEQLGEKKIMSKFQIFQPGMNELKDLKTIGNYAVQATWGDGHDTGIYTWEYLRQVFVKHAIKEQ